MSNAKTPNVVRAGWIMTASLLLSRVLGLIREAVISGRFGMGAETDAYVLSFQIPDIIFFLIAGGALSAAFIPVFSEYFHTNREEDAWRVFNSLFGIMSAALLVVITLAWIFAEPLTYVVAMEATANREMVAYLSRIVLPAQYAFFIGGLMFGTLYARQVFSVPGLGPNIYNVGIIVGALVLANFTAPSIAGLSWGALAGAFIGNIFVPLWVLRRMGVPFRPCLDFKHEGVRKVFRLMAPVVLGLSLPGVFALLIQNFGTLYKSDGINTAIKYGNTLMQVPLGIFGQSLAIAAFPALAQFLAQKRQDLFDDQLAKSLRLAIFLSVPFAGLFLAMPHEIIRSLFEHGNWKPENTDLTATGLRMFAIGIPAWCMQPIIMRGFYAAQRSVTPIIYGTIATAAFGAGGYLVARQGGSYDNLVLAGSLAAMLLAILLIGGAKKIAPSMDIKGILKVQAQTLVAMAIPAAALAALIWQFPALTTSGGKLGVLASTGFLALLYAWAYYFICKAFGLKETEYVSRGLNRRLQKGKSETPAGPEEGS